MNKVYMVVVRTEYYESVEKVFSSYRSAAAWLVEEGYEPYLFEGEISFEIMVSASAGETIDAEIISADVFK